MGTNSVSSWHRWATPAALSNSALLWYIPGGVTGVVFTVPLVERDAPDRLTWLVIALLSQGAFSGLVLLTRLVAPRLISKPVAILLTLILAGGVRGVVIYLLASSWQPMGFGVSPVFQILTSAVMSTDSSEQELPCHLRDIVLAGGCGAALAGNSVNQEAKRGRR